MTQTTYRTFESIMIARSRVVSKVLGLVGIAFLFTAVGAVIGLRTGSPHWLVWLAGGLGLLWLLRKVKERSPYNLLALYAFATWMGVGLAHLLSYYLARELGNLLVQAAAATAVVVIAAGTYGITTRRDLSSWGHLLFAGLIGVIFATVASLFLQVPLLHQAVSVVSALLFTAFIAYDLNRVAKIERVIEGDLLLLAADVYLDLLNLFVNLLSLLGGGDGDE